MKPQHVAMATAVPIIWGIGFALAKIGLGEIPPMFLMAMRYTLAALVLVWFFAPPKDQIWQVFAAAVVSGTITYGMVFTGLRDLYASTAILVVHLQVPFLAILGVIFLKEKVGLRVVIGMICAFGGVVLITGEPQVHENLIPVLTVIGGGLFWAVGQVMIRRIGNIGGMRLLAWIATFAAPQLYVASFFLEDGQWAAISAAGWAEWGVIFYLGLVMTAFAYSMWYQVLAHCEVSRVAPFLLLTPVSTVAASVLILGENLTPIVAAGGVVVITGIGIMTIEPGTWRRVWGRRGPAV